MNKQESITELINLITKECSLQDILNHLSKVLRCSVLLTDHKYRLIEFHEIADENSNLEQMIRLEHDRAVFNYSHLEYLDEKILANEMKHTRCILTIEGTDMDMIVFPIKDAKETMGFFIVLQPNRNNDDVEWIEQLVAILKIEMVKYKIKQKDRLNLRSDFVNYVLMGKITDHKELMTLCDMNGFDYSLKRLCIFVKPARQNGQSTDEQRRQEVKLMNLINGVCLEASLNTYKLVYNNNIIIFILFNRERDNMELNKYGYEIAQMINQVGKERFNIQCGVGKCYEGVNTLGKSFKQAVEAINLGAKLFVNHRVYSYFEDFIYYLLYDGLSYTQLNELYDDSLSKLARYDIASNSELVETLKCYFECRYRAKDTAQKLHLHRNTLAYRLDKIKDILECDFEDMKTNARIQMGLYAKELLGIHDRF